MNMNALVEEAIEKYETGDLPGAQLAAIREERNITQEYIAGKLHLRVAVIELLEADDYDKMPEPVFIKGYLRAYAKLLELDPEPLLDAFNGVCKKERKFDRALWQSKRESNPGEHIVKWVSIAFAIVVVIAVSMWWHKSKGNEHLYSSSAASQAESNARITDIASMQSINSSKQKIKTPEKLRVS